MFTGIIEAVAKVGKVTGRGREIRLTGLDTAVASDIKVGDSIAVNGVCLTVREKSGPELIFDAMGESLKKSNLGGLTAGSLVNIERAARLDTRLGGHLVSGHVDCTARLSRLENKAGFRLLFVSVPSAAARFIVPKGSVCVDGISLTVIDIKNGALSAGIVPHTFLSTNLKHRRPGDLLNIEVDYISRYVYNFLKARPSSTGENGAETDYDGL